MPPFHLPLPPRLRRLRESATLAINRRAREMRAAGAELTHFGFGESPFPPPPKMTAALAAHAGEKNYLPSLGLPSLREDIAAFYNSGGKALFDARRIAVGPGSKELIFHLLRILPGPVFLPAPSWVSYKPQAVLLGKKTVVVAGGKDRKITAAALDAAARPHRGGVLVINSPSNPSGAVWEKRELAALAAVCRRRRLAVIADEIYAQVHFNSASRAPSIAAHLPRQTIVTGGLSKAYSAGGWRLGFAAAAADSLQPVFDALAALISETFSCAAAPVQHAARLAYGKDAQVAAHVRDCAALHALAVNDVAARLRAAGLHCPPPRGGFYLMPSFAPFAARLRARGIKTSAALAAALLDECALAALPGSDFLLPPQDLALRLAAVDYDGAAALRRFRALGKNKAKMRRRMEKWTPSHIAGCRRLAQWLARC